MEQLRLAICNSIEDAPNYNEFKNKPKTLVLERAIIVRRGTEGGRDTVDLILTDDDGNAYVALVTAALLKTVTNNCIT